MGDSLPAVGGEFEISLETILDAGGPAPTWPFECYREVMSGRTGLALAERLIGRPGPVLLPSYLCDSVIQPFREAGRELAFYPVDETLTPDCDAIARLVEEVRPSAIVAIPYFGFPVPDAVSNLLHEVRGDALVIEDCTQRSLVGQAPGSYGTLGDVVVTSFRKYLAVPDGGLVVLREPRELPVLPPAGPEGAVETLVLAKAVRAQAAAAEDPDTKLELAYRLAQAGNRQLDERVLWHGMSNLSGRLLAALDLGAGVETRRANYEHLLAAFAGTPGLEPLFPELPDDVSPFVFAVRVDAGRRDSVRELLQRSRIFCAALWPLPPEIDEHAFAASHRVSREILCLPVDQRYGEAEMARVADRLSKALIG